MTLNKESNSYGFTGITTVAASNGALEFDRR